MNCDPIKAWRGSNLWSFRIFLLCILFFFIGRNELLLRLPNSTVLCHTRVRWNSQNGIIKKWVSTNNLPGQKWRRRTNESTHVWTHRSYGGETRWKFRWRTCVLPCACVCVYARVWEWASNHHRPSHIAARKRVSTSSRWSWHIRTDKHTQQIETDRTASVETACGTRLQYEQVQIHRLVERNHHQYMFYIHLAVISLRLAEFQCSVALWWRVFLLSLCNFAIWIRRRHCRPRPRRETSNTSKPSEKRR